jgi:hypothetical protein
VSEYIVQNGKQLAQVRPTDTNALVAVSKALKRKVVIMSIIVCNTTASAESFSIYLDNDGTTYDATTALFVSTPIAPYTTYVIEFETGLPMAVGTTGKLAVKSSTGSAITYTVNGVEG